MEHEPVQVGGDDETIDSYCALCAARANVDGAVVRAGVERITVVVDIQRPRVGPHAVSRAKALVCFIGGHITIGEGASHEEAIVNALAVKGVAL